MGDESKVAVGARETRSTEHPAYVLTDKNAVLTTPEVEEQYRLGEHITKVKIGKQKNAQSEGVYNSKMGAFTSISFHTKKEQMDIKTGKMIARKKRGSSAFLVVFLSFAPSFL